MVGKHMVLLVEDEESDVFFFRRCLSALDGDVLVRVVDTAWRARNYIEGFGEFKDRAYFPLPSLIVLDMHLPGASGLELLEWLQEHEATRSIPMFFWCGSLSFTKDMAAAIARATGHFVKTGDFSKTKEYVAAMLKHLPKLPDASK